MTPDELRDENAAACKAAVDIAAEEWNEDASDLVAIPLGYAALAVESATHGTRSVIRRTARLGVTCEMTANLVKSQPVMLMLVLGSPAVYGVMRRDQLQLVAKAACDNAESAKFTAERASKNADAVVKLLAGSYI